MKFVALKACFLYEKCMRVLSLAIFLLLVSVLPAHADDRLVLVTNTYEPYVYTEGDTPGLFPEVVSAAFGAVGVDIDIEYFPWKRCELLVRTGEVFAAFPYADLPEHDEYAWHADTVVRVRNVFFYKTSRMGRFDYASLGQLRGLRIAGTAGNAYESTFRAAGLTLDMATSEAFGIQKVFEGRADLFAEEERVGWALIAKCYPEFQGMFRATKTAWRETDMTIMVSRRYPDAGILMDRFNEGLRIIRGNGVYDAIIRKYTKAN